MSKILLSCALLGVYGLFPTHTYSQNSFYGGAGIGFTASKSIGSVDRTHSISHRKFSTKKLSTLPFGFKNHGTNLHAVFGYHWVGNTTYKSIDLLYQGGLHTQDHTLHNPGSSIMKIGIKRTHTFSITGRYGFKVDKGLYLYGSFGLWSSRFDVDLTTQNTPTAQQSKKYFGIAPGLGVIKKGDKVSLRVDYVYLYYTRALRLSGASPSGKYTLTFNPSAHILLLSIIFDL